mgnify:CR=1 FL=1
MEGNPLSHYGAQMKKLLLALVPALLAGAIAAPVVEAAPRPADRTVYIERTFAETVDLGDSGSSVGDLRATRGLVRKSLDGKVIGRYTTTQWTIGPGGERRLEERTITMEVAIGRNEVVMVSVYTAPKGETPVDKVAYPIVGGTGKYAGARGTMTLVPIDDLRKRLEFRFM